MQIAVANLSTSISDNDALYMTLAVTHQLLHDFAPLWERHTPSLHFYPKSAAIPSGAIIIAIYDELPEAPDALGYHTEDGSVISGKVGAKVVLDNGGVVLYDHANPQNVTVSSVLSHEVLETVVDAYVNDWSDCPDGVTDQAKEVGDPVESDSYSALIHGRPISLSNFVLPAYFDAGATQGPFDFLRKLNAPFTMTPGGYKVIRTENGKVSQVFGEHYPEWRKASKKHPLARTSRRMTKSR